MDRQVGPELGGGRRPEAGKVEIVGALDGVLEDRDGAKPRRPVGPGLAVDGRCQVPDAPLGDEPQRVRDAVDRRAVARPLIRHRDLAAGPQGQLERRQERRRLLRPSPAGRVHVQVAAGGLGGSAARLGQAGQQLDQGAIGRFTEPEVRQDTGRRRDHQAAQLGLGQAGQIGPVRIEQRPAAATARLGIDRDARHRERLHVAVDGPFRHLEPFRQHAGRQAAVPLEQEEDGEQAIGAHAESVAQNHDTRWHGFGRTLWAYEGGPTMPEPTADRPHIPGYGIPKTAKGILPWSWARERLDRAIVYWLATAGADGAPHLIPIWGAWVGDRWYVEGGPVRWQRNLRANPKLAIHVEFGEEVVMVEGTAKEIVAPEVARRGRPPRRVRQVQGGRELRG